MQIIDELGLTDHQAALVKHLSRAGYYLHEAHPADEICHALRWRRISLESAARGLKKRGILTTRIMQSATGKSPKGFALSRSVHRVGDTLVINRNN